MSRPLAILLVAAASAGCDDGPQYPQRTEGSLSISVSLNGILPSRTVSVIVDDTLTVPMSQPSAENPESAHGHIRLGVGAHRVLVTGLDPNCAAPEAQELHVSAYRFNGVEFEVRCSGAASLIGGGLAWVEDVDGWGNYLFFNTQDGEARMLSDGYGTADLAWSPAGNELATIDGGGSVTVFDVLAEQVARRVGSGLQDAAVAWGPGKDELSVLELRSACRIVILGAYAGTQPAIPCGAGTAIQQGAADIAWSPEGRLAAVASYHSPTFRVVDRATGELRHFDLPDAGFAPVATAWATQGGRVFVLGLCLMTCAPGRLALRSLDPRDGAWQEIGQWPTDVRATWGASLEVFGANHVAVGPVRGSVLLVPLDAPTQERILLGPDKFRVARRPG